MISDQRKWIVIDSADSASVDFKDRAITKSGYNSAGEPIMVVEQPGMLTSGPDYAHYSVDNSQMILSYLETLPSSVASIASKGTEMDRDAFETLLATDEWNKGVV